MSSSRLAPLLALLALVACQPLPQPFQNATFTPHGSPLLAPVGELSIFVPPVGNLPPEQRQAWAEALANALAERDLPASAQARAGLSSLLTTDIAEDGRGGAVWSWKLERRGTAALQGQGYPLGRTMEQIGGIDPRTRKLLAERLAEQIATALEAQVPEAGTAPIGHEGPIRVAILDFDGAPGDGNRSLRQSLRSILPAGGGLVVIDQPQDADFLIACSTQTLPVNETLQQVAIVWSLHAPDGTKVGSATQANRIPRGSLDGAWGSTAQAIALGGAEALRGMINRLQPGRLGPVGTNR